jgi:HAMP domain-containing protein
MCTLNPAQCASSYKAILFIIELVLFVILFYILPETRDKQVEELVARYADVPIKKKDTTPEPIEQQTENGELSGKRLSQLSRKLERVRSQSPTSTTADGIRWKRMEAEPNKPEQDSVDDLKSEENDIVQSLGKHLSLTRRRSSTPTAAVSSPTKRLATDRPTWTSVEEEDASAVTDQHETNAIPLRRLSSVDRWSRRQESLRGNSRDMVDVYF